MMCKKNILTVCVTALISVIAMGGISANADTLNTIQSNGEYYIPKQTNAIYNKSSLLLSYNSPSEPEVQEKTLQDTIIEGISNFEETIDISAYGIKATEEGFNTLSDVVNEVFITHPTFFHLDGGFTSGSLGDTIVQIQFDYNCTQEEYTQKMDEIDSKFDEILSVITDDMSDQEKALLVHDYLCNNFKYDLDYQYHDMYNFVHTGKGVCQSYTLSYSYLMSKLGIENYMVMNNDIQHIWNMLKIDGNYYHVDVTWDDYTPDLLGWSSHTYFLVDDEYMSTTNHAKDGSNWYLYQDISATDTTYSEYFWRQINSPFIVLNSKCYCLDKGIFYEYNFSDNSLTQVCDLISDVKWYNLTASVPSFYKNKFSTLQVYNDVFLYNTPYQVYISNSDGSNIVPIYTYESADDSDAIFGMKLDSNGNVILQIEYNVNASREDFSTNFITIPAEQVATLYQDYKQGLITTATTTELTTTEPTTITTTTEPTTTTTEVTTTTVPDTTTTTEVTTVTLNCDFNSDGVVDNSDLLTIKNSILNGNYDQALDLNGDGSVNVLDYMIIKSYLMKE